MPSTKTLRRRRGRAIRKQRRAMQSATTFSGMLRALEIGLVALAKAFETVARAAWNSARVIVHRLTPAFLPPDSRGAGARRQLLHNGRKPMERRW